MNAFAQAYIDELESNGFKYLPLIENDEDTVVPVGMNIKTTSIKIYAIFKNNNNVVDIKCHNLVKITEKQFPQALLCCNRLNNDYKWVKFYIDEEDEYELTVQVDALLDEESAGREVMRLMILLCNICDEAFPRLNRAIWADV